MYEDGFPDCALSRWPKSLKKASASGPDTPLVSIAMGTNWWLTSSSAYFLFLCCSAWEATEPASLTDSPRWEGAKVLGHVTSQTNARPRFQGVMEAPSGRLPSDRHTPVGSNWAGIPADDRCLWIRPLTLACRGWRPWLLQQLRPWVPRLSTLVPQCLHT